jgi:hypothetical protein
MDAAQEHAAVRAQVKLADSPDRRSELAADRRVPIAVNGFLGPMSLGALVGLWLR